MTTESDLQFVESIERLGYFVSLSINERERLLRLAKTAALIVEHRIRVGYYDEDFPNDDGEYGYRAWPPFHVEQEVVNKDLHAAVRAVDDKIKEQKA
jgi:hypothetical protein